MAFGDSILESRGDTGHYSDILVHMYTAGSLVYAVWVGILLFAGL